MTRFASNRTNARLGVTLIELLVVIAILGLVLGRRYDIDFNSQQEGRHLTRRTYAAVTARSYHRGLVNCVFMDGSVRSIRDEIDSKIWRAHGTRGAQGMEANVNVLP